MIPETAIHNRAEIVLIVGSGAREHAIAAALSRSLQRPRLICFGSSTNPGIRAISSRYATGDVTDAAGITAFAVQNRVTLAIIGPEAPLAAGVADALWAAGIAVVGPTQSLARVESSKAFTRELLATHRIPGNPAFQRFDSTGGLEDFLARFPQHVIKDDGLVGGKGVKVFGEHLHTMADSLGYCEELLAAGRPFVVEEKLEGEEFSMLSFVDGYTVVSMPIVQDHKRAHAGDTGPNTGGMGSYTDSNQLLPFLTEDDAEAAHEMNHRVAQALEKECGAPFQGILYGGFMATRDGVRLIEYNARFGDPECLNLLTLLKTDFLDICRAIADRTLNSLAIAFLRQASVCKYLVPEGYPDAPRKGDAIVLPIQVPAGITTYFGAVDVDGGRLVATGSRTLGIVATAATIYEAEALCERVITEIEGPFFHRADIGTAAALQKRAQHMDALRSR